MTQKTVNAHVYGKDYALACDAGQEQHLTGLVQDINARALQLEKAVGKLPEALMLLYTALMVADELHDSKRDHTRAKEELIRTKEEVVRLGRQLDDAGGEDARLAELEAEVAQNLHTLATRIDGLADKLAA